MGRNNPVQTSSWSETTPTRSKYHAHHVLVQNAQSFLILATIRNEINFVALNLVLKSKKLIFVCVIADKQKEFICIFNAVWFFVY